MRLFLRLEEGRDEIGFILVSTYLSFRRKDESLHYDEVGLYILKIAKGIFRFKRLRWNDDDNLVCSKIFISGRGRGFKKNDATPLAEYYLKSHNVFLIRVTVLNCRGTVVVNIYAAIASENEFKIELYDGMEYF